MTDPINNRVGKPDKPHLFFRLMNGKEHFYIVNIYGDYEDLVHNASANPGTLRIETPDGKIVWRPN